MSIVHIVAAIWTQLTEAAFSLSTLFLSTVLAQTSTFIQNAVDGTSSNLTFAVRIPANSSDLVFNLTGPASKSWVAVGAGSQMAGSMMFIAYSDASGQSKQSELV